MSTLDEPLATAIDLNKEDTATDFTLMSDQITNVDLDEDSPLRDPRYHKVGPISEAARDIGESDWRQMRFQLNHKLRYDDHWVSGLFVIIGLTFIPIGIYVFLLSLSISEQRFAPYSDETACQITEGNYGVPCEVVYQLTSDFKPPIYVYYHLEQVYQNHRAMVKSRQESQLRGETPERWRDCKLDQQEDNKNTVYEYAYRVKQGEPYTLGKIMYPCGAAANSFFNDRILMSYCTQTVDKGQRCKKMCSHARCMAKPNHKQWTTTRLWSSPNWIGENIAWVTDLEKKFGAYKPTADTTLENHLQLRQNLTLPITNDEDFVVWMRPAVTQSFPKLYRIIKQQEFKKGDIIKLNIENYFQVSRFNGKKSVVISTMSVLGGRNPFLGLAFMMTGGISMVMFLVFFLSSHNEEIPIDRDPNHQSIVDDSAFAARAAGTSGGLPRAMSDEMSVTEYSATNTKTIMSGTSTRGGTRTTRSG